MLYEVITLPLLDMSSDRNRLVFLQFDYGYRRNEFGKQEEEQKKQTEGTDEDPPFHTGWPEITSPGVGIKFVT